MAAKSVALGTLIRIDFAGGSTYATVARTKGHTPPDQVGTEADGKELGDTFEVPIMGIEGPSTYTLTQYWYPGDTVSDSFVAAFNNRRLDAGASGGVLGVQLAYPHDGVAQTDNMPTEEFTARVIGITKEPVGDPNGVYLWTITMRRTSAITESTYTVP